MTAGANNRRTITEPEITRQSGRSLPTRSIIVQPVIRMAAGNAPIPIMESAALGAPVILSSKPSPTRISPKVTAMNGPFSSFRQENRRSPLIIITPTDQIAISTPMLWTKSMANTPDPQRISMTGAAVKPKF